MRRARIVVLFCSLAGLSPWLAGCGASAAPIAAPIVGAIAVGGDDGCVVSDDVRELEARLEVATTEARALRSELESARLRSESVRIGETRAPRQETSETEEPTLALSDSFADDEPRERASSDSRPVLRLYGPATRPASSSDVAALPGPVAPPIVAAPPTGALDRLPVVVTDGAPDQVPAIPETPIIVAAPSPTLQTSAAVEGPAEREYRVALEHVSSHRWDAALAALAAFVAQHPEHPYADNAMYWRGEVLYAQRDYARAITELTSMIEQFPQGNKVPDALLRIGFCFQRLGESERARRVFRRVREQYPGTVAARTASREDA